MRFGCYTGAHFHNLGDHWMKWSNWLYAIPFALVSFNASAGLTTPEISGLLDVRAISAEDFNGKKSTDIQLTKLELRVDATLQQLISAHIAFLYEEDRTDFQLDEGSIILGPSAGKSFVFGKMYLPFGRYDSFMVSDPQTLVMGETTETVMMLAVDNAAGYGSIYLFNGDSTESAVLAAGDDDTVSGGFNLGRREGDRYDLGMSYITNITDSNTLQRLESTPGSGNAGVVNKGVPGASVHLKMSSGKTTFIAEQVMALESFENGDLDGLVTSREQPTATNYELGFVREDGSVLAFGYQTTEDAQFIGLPKSVTSVVMRKEVMRGASMALEYAQIEDYATSAGGSGRTVDMISLQVAMEF